MADEEIKTTIPDEPDIPSPTPEEIEQWERERAEQEEAAIAPAKRAKERLDLNEEVVAEHDELLSDILFEITMKEMEV